MVAESFVLAAAQAEPVYHDKEATVDKTCRWIERAGDQSVDLLVFPETYVPGYPYWIESVDSPRWSELMVDLQTNSLHVEDDAIDTLCETAAEAAVNVVLGANERSDRAGSETVYNTLFYFDRSGTVIGRHRKLMPTHRERTVWGRGDPSSLRTYDTDVGRLGGLICYENHMTLSKAALAAMGEEIHAAVWPGFWELGASQSDTVRAEDGDAIETCDIYPAVREYAFETQTFVVSSSMYLSEATAEAFGADELEHNWGAGGSMIVNPGGVVKAGPVFGEERLVTAELERDERRVAKAYFDAMGHYARWDAVNLEVSDATLEPVRSRDRSDARKSSMDRPNHDGTAQNGSDGRPSAIEMAHLAEEHAVSVDTVEDIATHIVESQRSTESFDP